MEKFQFEMGKYEILLKEKEESIISYEIKNIENTKKLKEEYE